MSAPLPWAANVFYTPTQLCQRYELLYQATVTQPNQDNDPATDVTHIFWDVYDPGGGGNVVTSVVADVGITVTGGTSAAPSIGTNLVAGAGIATLPGVGTTLGISNTGILSVDTGGAGITANTVSGATTLTNTGVTSVIAGSGISVTSATGAVTISASAGFVITTQVLMASQNISAGQSVNLAGPTGGEGLYCLMGCSTPVSTGVTRASQLSVMAYVNSGGQIQMGGSGLAIGGGNGVEPILVPVDGSPDLFFQNRGVQQLNNFSIVAFKMSGPIAGTF